MEKPKYARCMYCMESKDKRYHKISSMHSVDDSHLGVGLICATCFKGCLKEFDKQVVKKVTNVGTEEVA